MDLEQQSEMIAKNEGFIVYWAKFYARLFPTVDIADIIQEGRIGFAESMERFNPALGQKPIAFARWRVRGRMSRFCKWQCQDVRVPVTGFHRLNFDLFDEPDRETGETLLDIMPAEEPAQLDAGWESKIISLLDRLTDREREVIRLRFWEDKTQEEIGGATGRSRQAIQNLEHNAMQKIRQWCSHLEFAA